MQIEGLRIVWSLRILVWIREFYNNVYPVDIQPRETRIKTNVRCPSSLSNKWNNICEFFMCHPAVHRELDSHTVKENAAQRSDAHSQPAHRFSGWKSPCAQRGQIWYRSTAGKGGSKGQYWYGSHFCLGKSLRECKRLLFIVWGHIQSQVLLVCVTGLESECTCCCC